MIHDQEMYEAGLAMRRQVLGDRYVDPQLEIAKTDAVWEAIQDAATELAWGHIWTRPGLEPKTRSMLNLAMLTALGKMPELRTHVRGALRNGVTKEEIIEVLLQATIYCGFPAGIDAFRNAREVINEEGA
jgi:4-carboxymuconolactone decarboxylase